MGYKRKIGEVIDSVDVVVTEIQTDVDKVLTSAARLKQLINKDEYETEVALGLADDVVDKLQEVWEKLKKLSDDLY